MKNEISKLMKKNDLVLIREKKAYDLEAYRVW